MKTRFMKPTGVRRYSRTTSGRFRGGKLAPVRALAVRESESGYVQQSVLFRPDSVSGELLTDVRMQVVSVFVPAPAIDALKNPDDQYTGSEDVFREKLKSGTPVFDLEPESEISKRLGINPRSVNGVPMVNEAVRLAHNVAVNFLRTRAYPKAQKLDSTNLSMTPAIVSRTVMEQLGGVLDPSDRVDGQVQLDLQGKLKVKGIGVQGAASADGTVTKESDGTATAYAKGWKDANSTSTIRIEEDPDNAGYPNIYTEFTNDTAIGLIDFYRTERMDRLDREMSALVEKHPEQGEEMLVNFAYALEVETGNQPFVVYEAERSIRKEVRSPFDYANFDEIETDMMGMIQFTAPIPNTEFGGILITFAALKPDETIADQPEPFLSDVWAGRNFVADSLELEPKAVTVRSLDSECAQADEGKVAFYTGHNHLLRSYVSYGLDGQVDPTTVANRTAFWQYELPLSVTPDNILYPEDLDHYPFKYQLAEVCTYTCTSTAVFQTPIVFGPTPVEDRSIISSANLYNEEQA